MSTEFKIGDRVRIVSLPPYFKTAEPMPMLRPPSVVALGEEGIISDRRPGDYWCVKFAQGAFLVESKYLELLQKSPHTMEGGEGD
ncbi:MAG: DUF3148 domain-containing protein [Gloeocapsa sp. DLM2.Bin57]|nr:MAG: DUF3148 domain-containing protein [Gloeocapsa sp. DLM2.Bin57]